MSTIKIGVCPFCLQEKQLAYFQFGVIKSTMCVYCLQRYIDKAIIPNMLKASTSETIMIGADDVEKSTD